MVTFPPLTLIPSEYAPESPQKKLAHPTLHASNRKPPTPICIHWAELLPPAAMFSLREDSEENERRILYLIKLSFPFLKIKTNKQNPPQKKHLKQEIPTHIPKDEVGGRETKQVNPASFKQYLYKGNIYSTMHSRQLRKPTLQNSIHYCPFLRTTLIWL